MCEVLTGRAGQNIQETEGDLASPLSSTRYPPTGDTSRGGKQSPVGEDNVSRVVHSSHESGQVERLREAFKSYEGFSYILSRHGLRDVAFTTFCFSLVGKNLCCIAHQKIRSRFCGQIHNWKHLYLRFFYVRRFVISP